MMIRIVFFALALMIVTGCSNSGIGSIETCRSTSSKIVEDAKGIYQPMLTNTKSIDEYFAGIEKHQISIEEDANTLLKCMKSSALVASESDTSKWIPIGVGVKSLSVSWEQQILEKEEYSESDVAYLVSQSLISVEAILENEI